MKTNVQITAVKKVFKNGQNGFEVKVEGMDGKLDCKMNFHDPLKAMRYMFLLSKRLELQIDSIQLAAVSLAYQRAKEAEQRAVEEAVAAANEVGKSEHADSPSPSGEDVTEEAPAEKSSSLFNLFDELKAKQPDAILLFRSGDFYEAYREDAQVCAKVLGITLRKRINDDTAMAGFPIHALEKFLPLLIRAGQRVALCDLPQNANPNSCVSPLASSAPIEAEEPKPADEL